MADPMPSKALAGKIALVTGAAVRVGRAVAMALARAGADVAVHYRSSRSQADSTVEDIRRLGRRGLAAAADLASPEDCRRLVRETVSGLGGLDLLVHSASNFHRAPLERTDEALWDSALNVNARAAYLMARQAAGILRERRGRVVLISDFLARDPARDYLAHSVSKSAVEGLTRALAVELAPEVLVNAVAPGTVLFPDGTSAEEVERAARRTLLKRNGTPEDVAQAVVFFCAGPSFLTGQVLSVDGGRSVK